MKNWLRQHPQVRSVRLAVTDLNGHARGKRVPTRFSDKVFSSGIRCPFSALNVDIWGEDIEDSPLVFETGDRDGVMKPTERGLLPVPWLDTPSALMPVWTFHEDGRPFQGDPRHALDGVLNRYRDRGLQPVVAVELEFYLIDDSGPELQMPPSPRTSKRRKAADTLSLQALDCFDGFFNDLYDACEAMDIPADAAISETGYGQFEINLMHSDDALRAADDAWLFKMLVKGIARQHGFAASFMAKPYPDGSGSGLHTHFSVLDKGGRNIFDDGGSKGTDQLRHGINGCIEAMRDSTLIFAPHANSYARMVPGAHAPTGICWAYENRTAAIRVPGGSPAARRIEHRVAGGDVNPYLMLAAILGAAMNGLEDANEPPEPISGNSYAQDLPQIPNDWGTAIDAFESSPHMARIFHPELIRNLVMTKRQELRCMDKLNTDEQTAIYLETV